MCYPLPVHTKDERVYSLFHTEYDASSDGTVALMQSLELYIVQYFFTLLRFACMLKKALKCIRF